LTLTLMLMRGEKLGRDPCSGLVEIEPQLYQWLHHFGSTNAVLGLMIELA
jgi:hypothetical protein